MRLLYRACGSQEISETLSRKLGTAPSASLGTGAISETSSRKIQTTPAKSPVSPFNLADVARAFTALPDEKTLATELEKTRKQLESRK
jgi:hypothetical protein